MSHKDWTETVMLHGWPESGYGAMSLEQLYQQFKARLVEEVIGELPTHDKRIVQIVPLRDTESEPAL